MNNKSILLIEDNEIIVRAYKQLLENAGYSVQTCNNGKAALNVLEALRFDLVILDLMIPEIDGMEVLKRARSLLWQQRTAVVVFSSVNLDIIKEATKKYGVDHFIDKDSASPETVLDIVKQCMVKAPGQPDTLVLSMAKEPALRKRTAVADELSLYPDPNTPRKEIRMF